VSPCSSFPSPALQGGLFFPSIHSVPEEEASGQVNDFSFMRRCGVVSLRDGRVGSIVHGEGKQGKNSGGELLSGRAGCGAEAPPAPRTSQQCHLAAGISQPCVLTCDTPIGAIGALVATPSLQRAFRRADWQMHLQKQRVWKWRVGVKESCQCIKRKLSLAAASHSQACSCPQACAPS
jgi:hypothetical protein